MNVDLTAARLSLSCLKGETEFEELWNSEAYQIIREFSDRFGGGLSKEEMKAALKREDIDLLGLGTLRENLPDVKDFLDTIEDKEEEWIKVIEGEVDRVIPKEDTSDLTIHVFPTFYYGIGLQDGVCINLNEPHFFDKPRQFVYQAIHESTHPLYGDVHGIPSIHQLESPEDKVSFFNTLLHSEGYAVYTPLRLRKEEGHTGKENPSVLKDYQVITDETKMKEYIEEYDSLREDFENIAEWDLERLLEKTFQDKRYTYRIGGWMVKEIEEKMGMDEVREAFYMDADEFVKKYDPLLDRLG